MKTYQYNVAITDETELAVFTAAVNAEAESLRAAGEPDGIDGSVKATNAGHRALAEYRSGRDGVQWTAHVATAAEFRESV